MKKIFSVLLALSLIIVYSEYAIADLEDGLVAYWPLNINANDATGNGNHGTEYGGVAYVGSMMGGAAEFDGLNDYIDIPYSAIIEPAILSISLWLKSDKQARQLIIDTDHANSGSHGYGLGITETGFADFYVDPSSTMGSHVRSINSENIVNGGTWHHVVAIYDADLTLSMYVDGIFQPDMAAGGYARTHRSIRIGMRRSTSSTALRHYFRGTIDEIRIYDRVLSQHEIQQLYSEPLLAADAGPDQIVFDEITLDGSQSYDPNSTIVSYQWYFHHREHSACDRTAEGVTPAVSDLAPGFYDVTLTVTNDAGTVNTDTMLFTAIGCKGDFDGDHDIDGSDLAEFAVNFGRTDCPSCP